MTRIIVQKMFWTLATLFCLLSGFASVVSAQEVPITDLTFSPDGKMVVSCSQKGIQIWSWPKLELQTKINSSSDNLHCVKFSPDGKKLSVGGGNPSDTGTIEIFGWPECKLLKKFSKHADCVRSIEWLDHSKFVSASLDGTVKLWDIAKSKPIRTMRGHSRGVNSVCWVKDGILVSCGIDNSVRVWNVDSGELIRSLDQHTRSVVTSAKTPTKGGLPMIATASEDRTIRFWQPTIGRMVRYIRLKQKPLDLVWIDETTIVASCVDGTAVWIDAVNVKPIRSSALVKGWAYAIARNPLDGSMAIAGSDGKVRKAQ